MSQHNAPKKIENQQRAKHRKLIAILSAIAAVLVLFGLGFIIGRPLLAALKNKENFRLWIDAQGFWKYWIMVGIVALQVIVAIIPGEPIEFAAGYAFGAWGGLALCLIGIGIGSIVIILLTRKYGMRMVHLFVDDAKIEELSQKLLADKSKLDTVVFVLFLIPGTPKDLITYFIGITTITLPRFLFLSSVARIPSIISSTMGGSMVGKQRYKAAVVVMTLTMVLSAVIFLVYRYLIKRDKKKQEHDRLTDNKENNEKDV
ncbi:MAG: TVP38/TMEM64 family protein [Clostridiales bacterium]|nr:TVP38/TMEM64 family protein [Clostridiales bacterium]